MKQKTKSKLAIIIFAILSLYGVYGIITSIPALASAGIDAVIVLLASRFFCIFPALMSIIFIRKRQAKKIAKFRFFIIYAIGTYMPYSKVTFESDPVGCTIAILSVIVFTATLFKLAPGPKMYLKHVLGGEESEEYNEDNEEE